MRSLASRFPALTCSVPSSNCLMLFEKLFANARAMPPKIKNDNNPAAEMDLSISVGWSVDFIF